MTKTKFELDIFSSSSYKMSQQIKLLKELHLILLMYKGLQQLIPLLIVFYLSEKVPQIYCDYSTQPGDSVESSPPLFSSVVIVGQIFYWKCM